MEAFENMKQNAMKTIEAGDNLKALCDTNDYHSYHDRVYDNNMYKSMHL